MYRDIEASWLEEPIEEHFDSLSNCNLLTQQDSLQTVALPWK